ncbi:MAG TPA: hypothetical protein VGI64_02725 [Streptosporangiaceae bacterium]
MTWSDQEEVLLQQHRKRGWVMRATFAAFVALAVAAYLLPGAASYVALAAALAALAGTILLGAVWRMNGSIADSYGQAARDARAERRHRLARRERAIRTGTWRPSGRG